MLFSQNLFREALSSALAQQNNNVSRQCKNCSCFYCMNYNPMEDEDVIWDSLSFPVKYLNFLTNLSLLAL